MRIENMRQLWQLLVSLAAGGVLGFLYDLARALRRELKGSVTAALTDLLFWVCAALMLFTLGMSTGQGQLRLFMLCGVLGGAAVYFLTLSAPVIWLCGKVYIMLEKVADTLLTPVKKLVKKCEIIKKISKNLFQKIIKWFTIIEERRREAKNRYAQSRKEAATYENQKGRTAYENNFGGFGAVRDYQPDLVQNKGVRRAGRAGSAREPGTKPRRGKRGNKVRHRTQHGSRSN